VGNGVDGKHYWLTPSDLYAELNAEFRFDFDPCPYPLPPGFDGLTCEWGMSNYVNPPFGSIMHYGKKKGMTAWVKKAIAEHAQGKRVVFVDGAEIVATEGANETRIALADIPLTRNGTIGFQVENAMSSIAAAWALGIDWTVIRRGLATFVNVAATAPGRFNLFDYKGATLIADYGHNPDAIQALCNAVATMPAQRRMVVISGAGDRRDEDIRKQTQILGGVFDDVVLYEDQCQRGRADGEVLALLREGLQGASRTSRVDEIRGEFLAIDTALGRLQPGDLCLILIDQVEEALEHIARRVAE
jgi:cyanophycin synthetase